MACFQGQRHLVHHRGRLGSSPTWGLWFDSSQRWFNTHTLKVKQWRILVGFSYCRLEAHNERTIKELAALSHRRAPVLTAAAAYRPIYYTHGKIPIPDGLVQEGWRSAAGAKLHQTLRECSCHDHHMLSLHSHEGHLIKRKIFWCVQGEKFLNYWASH